VALLQQGNSAALVVSIARIPDEGLAFQAEVTATHLQLPPATEVELPRPVQVQGWLTKVAEQVYFQGMTRGTLAVPCSRCLDIIHSDFAVEMRVVYLPPSTRLHIEGEEGVDAEDVRRAFVRAMAAKPVPRIDLEHVAPIRISVTDAITELVEELPRLGRTTFRDLTSHLVDRLQVVVRFLAVLELFKDGLVDLDQPRTFGDIGIVWRGEDGVRELGDVAGLDDLATVDAYDG